MNATLEEIEGLVSLEASIYSPSGNPKDGARRLVYADCLSDNEKAVDAVWQRTVGRWLESVNDQPGSLMPDVHRHKRWSLDTLYREVALRLEWHGLPARPVPWSSEVRLVVTENDSVNLNVWLNGNGANGPVWYCSRTDPQTRGLKDEHELTKRLVNVARRDYKLWSQRGRDDKKSAFLNEAFNKAIDTIGLDKHHVGRKSYSGDTHPDDLAVWVGFMALAKGNNNIEVRCTDACDEWASDAATLRDDIDALIEAFRKKWDRRHRPKATPAAQ